MTEKPYKTFLCSYPFAGSFWAFEIMAESHEEAESRLKAMGWAKVDGEIMMQVHRGTPIWLVSLVVRLRNWWMG